MRLWEVSFDLSRLCFTEKMLGISSLRASFDLIRIERNEFIMVSQVPTHRQVHEKLYILKGFPDRCCLVRTLPHSTGLLGLDLNTSCNFRGNRQVSCPQDPSVNCTLRAWSPEARIASLPRYSRRPSLGAYDCRKKNTCPFLSPRSLNRPATRCLAANISHCQVYKLCPYS